jgi:hypothetical protein
MQDYVLLSYTQRNMFSLIMSELVTSTVAQSKVKLFAHQSNMDPRSHLHRV